jgi:hypothetical protein
MEFDDLVRELLERTEYPQKAVKGKHYNSQGKLRKGDAGADGPGGPKFRMNPKHYTARSDEEEPEEDAEYRGRKVSLNKPTRGDVKKFKVYVKDPKTGNVKKVNFGHGGTSAKRKGEKTMKIRKSNPKARKSFRARHNCDNPGPKTKARYWSCRKW